jgi:hypothetical protein
MIDANKLKKEMEKLTGGAATLQKMLQENLEETLSKASKEEQTEAAKAFEEIKSELEEKKAELDLLVKRYNNY